MGDYSVKYVFVFLLKKVFLSKEIIRSLFIRGLVCRKTNRKLQKLSPFLKMVECLLSASSPLTIRIQSEMSLTSKGEIPQIVFLFDFQ